jgi:hypothetical protein
MKTVLVLLDYTAAFDAVDHDILLDILRVSFGISGVVLDWIRSFLSERVQEIRVGSSASEPVSLRFGVPQGSVLGPLLYIIYTADIIQVFESHGFKVHLYADDSQLYIHLELVNVRAILQSTETCLHEVKQWSSSRRLLLNAGKTEFMIMDRSGKVQLTPDEFSICFGGATLKMMDVARSLGVMMDSRLTMKPFISRTSRSCFYQLRRIRQIRSCLSDSCAKTVTVALVLSRLDYCSSVLAGLPSTSLKPLTSALSTAARVVTGSSSRCHVTPLFRELHWLPVQARIQYKLCLMMYNITAPVYLAEMTTPCSSLQSRQSLRSASSGRYIVPTTKLKFGERSFAVAGPTAWNALPDAVRTETGRRPFKKALKTALFRRYL